MLNSFYQDIVDILEVALDEEGFTSSNFGVGNLSEIRPFFKLDSCTFLLKAPQFKRIASMPSLLDTTEDFTISPQQKRGPYALLNPASEITSVLVIENPASETESSIQLQQNQYNVDNKELHLLEDFSENSKLSIAYKYLGHEYTDRFEDSFTLNIYSDNLAEQEKLSMLTLPIIWSGMEALTSKTYSFSSGAFHTHILINDLVFEAQENFDIEQKFSQLKFHVNGKITFVRTQADGFHLIEEVIIPKTNILRK